MLRGIVFDMQRCALHDGDGIRSVLFLKGCPLHCEWCCNPESQTLRPQLFYRRRLCRQCGACAAVCPSGALTLRDGMPEVRFGRCLRCGRCGGVCPAGAVGLYGREMTVSEAVRILSRDERYYKASGGGITLSGGEPLVQSRFACGILRQGHLRGWNTAVETTGFVSSEALCEAVPAVDTFLFDYKLTDPYAHRRHTGSVNAPALASLRLLAGLGAEVVLRVPLLPGINDTDKHLRAIVTLQREMPNIRGIEVMPLHGYAAAKYGDIGRPVPGIYARPASETGTALWIERLKEAGAVEVKQG